jgi:ABC-type dipeptide/oligopeptide/nickel transport system permease subunit
MEELLNNLTELLRKLSDKHGEQAVTTLLETAQLMVMNDIIQNAIAMVFGIVLIIIAYNTKKSDEFYYDTIKFFCYVFGVIFFMVSVSSFANPVLWKSLTDPKYYVTYQIMKKGLK